MKAIQITALFCLCLCSCTEQTTEKGAGSGEALRIEDVRLMTAQKKDWITTFGTRAGVWEGSDSDGSIAFMEGGRVVVTEFGYAIIRYEGSYSVDADGLISLELPEYEFDWPKMKLRRVEGKFLLHRVGVVPPSASLVETGALGDSDSLWPFGLQTLSWPEPDEETENSEPSLPLFPPD